MLPLLFSLILIFDCLLPLAFTLLNELKNHGKHGIALQIIESYLSDRKQYVNVLGEISEKLPVMFGVP